MAGAERRARIADAVIATLAREGSRGLTHRAVDAAAGLPAGSTSYYLPSRAALFTAAVERLAELDAAQVAALPEGDLAEALAGLIEGALVGPGRDRTLARYELSLEAVRRPELRQPLAAGTERLQSLLAERLATVPSAQERASRARDLLAFIDGVLFADATGIAGPPRSPERLRETVRSALRSFAQGHRVACRGPAE